MAATTGQISGDVIDAIRPDLEAFASLWSALRTNYQGTNITKTVARLLHMYQPEDGVLAYERLLRTLYVLLEDFDGDGLRLLVSMVPPPKGVPDEIIKQVFHKATGFVRLNAPIFHRNNNSTNSESDVNSSSSVKNSDGCMDPRTTLPNASTPRLQTVLSNAENAPQGTTILRAIVKSDVPQKTNKSPKIRPRDSEVFRGFPSNEITNTQSHARNMTHFYGPSSNYGGYPQRYVDYREPPQQAQNSGPIPPRGMDSSAYRFKWLETPMLVRKNNYDGSASYPDLILKTSDNKFIRLPITKINGPPIGSFNSSYNTPIQTAYQAYYQNSQLHLRHDDYNLDATKSDLLEKKNPSNFYPKKNFEENEKSDEYIRGKMGAFVNPRIGLVDHDYGCLRSEMDYSMEIKENYEIGNLASPNNETIEKFRDTVKNSQRAIQEDIYRMDVVRCDDDDDFIHTNVQEFNYFNVESLDVSEELKKAASDFLKRAEEEQILESPRFPRTRMLQDPENYPPLNLKSSPRAWKIQKLEKYREKSEEMKDSTMNFPGESVFRDCSENIISSTKNSTTINQNSSRGNRGKIGRNSKSEKMAQKITNYCRNSSANNCPQNSGTINDDNSGLICASPMESVIKRNETIHQANSMADLVNYRKQYYDALLSIQRAKVAVANSLAISSSQSSTSCDPRVFRYLQRQHQLLQQQQQRLLMASQHPVNRHQAFLQQQQQQQPNYSNIRGAAAAAALWIRGGGSNAQWKYSPCAGQYAFPRQTYPMSSSSSSSCPPQVPISGASESSISENCPRNPHNLNRTSRPAVKRRKLEDIVGKLKDTDDHN